MKLSMMTKKYAPGSVIQFPTKSILLSVVLTKTTRQGRCLWTSTNTYRELWWWEDFRLHANACPVWFCWSRAFCFNRCEWKSKNKFKIYSREISRNVGYSLYKGHFMVKVRSDFWRIYLWIVDFEIYRISYFIYLYRTFWFRLVFWAR